MWLLVSVFSDNVEQQISSQSLEPFTVNECVTVVKERDVPKCVGQLKRVTQSRQEPPLPKPFPLPRNFPPLVALALKEKKVTSKARAKFVTTMANAIFLYKSYPTSQELRDVSREAMKSWEFLGAKSGCVSSSLYTIGLKCCQCLYGYAVFSDCFVYAGLVG